MEKEDDIRWKQRFNNFQRSIKVLEKSLEIVNPNETEQAGIILFYELSFELAWKVLKDYLEFGGFNTKSPREVIKIAFQTECISNGQKWLEALEDRNLIVYTYDEANAISLLLKIRVEYFPLLKELHEWLLLKL